MTSNHSIYSSDRLDFVPAGELRVGETLRNLDGDVRIESIEQLGTEERVYNLEIHGEHVFRVASSGVLVHNSSGAEGRAQGPTAGGGADLQRALVNMTPEEITRIQNAANRTGQPIHVVGSRSGGSKTPRPDSDWDYVIQANNHTRRSDGNSLPGAKNLKEGIPSNQDIFKGPLDYDRPHITFHPDN